MTRKEKISIIEGLAKNFQAYNYFYIVDASGLSVEEINEFRDRCSQESVTYQVAKNTLIAKALQKIETRLDYTAFNDTVLKGFSGILFVQGTGRIPAKIVKEFRKHKNLDKPTLKGAVIDGDLFVGEEHLAVLSKLKSRAELIGEIIVMLKLPITTMMASIHGSKHKLTGILKALSARKH